MRLYLDAAPVIYLVEQVLPYAPAVEARLSAAETVQVASDLTRLECRVKPLREGNAALLQDYDDYFEEAVTAIIALSREVMDYATKVRAEYGFKTPDAVHLAAAVTSGCHVFLTNDHRLDRFSGLTIEVVQPGHS